MAELERVDFGITREGLVRNGTRHIKDDGRPVDDPGSRILGWSIDRKIAALRRQIQEAEQRATMEGRAAADAARLAEAARARVVAARELASVEDFSEIDPARWSRQLIALKAEQKRLQESSREIRVLRDRLVEIDKAIDTGERELARLNGAIAVAEADLETTGMRADSREKQLARFTDYDHETAQAGFREVTATLPLLTLDNSDQLCALAMQRLQGRINNEQGRINNAVEAMLTAMNNFVAQFPEFRQTLEPGRVYADSFLAVLQRVEHEDLPRHRERFEHYLNENLVGDLLMLSRRLEDHQEAIEERIAEINSALHRIDYADDTYVQLRLVNRPIQEVADFRRALRACFEHGIAPGPDERLVIFERVRRLVEGFQRDPDGTQRVTDVRNWFAAGVRELRRADHAEVNYYTATTGKSGGQKAKLAFTILASALSAQYGLSTAAEDAANFRLVVIDEAFSRTDESNSTRAMELFSRLGFQLLIVGPFDAKAKLAVPFVQTVHLASNPGGNRSRLLALTRDQVESVPGGDAHVTAASALAPTDPAGGDTPAA